MALTVLLDDRHSPVHKHFEATYPNLSAVRWGIASEPVGTVAVGGNEYPVSTVPRFAVGVPKVLPREPLPGERHYGWGGAGMAFDYRVRLLLAPQDPSGFVAAAGARNLAGRARRRTLPPAWLDLVVALVDAQLDQPAADPVVADAGSVEVARLCGLLALYEQLYRMPPAYLEEHPLVVAGPDATLEDQLNLVDERMVDDVVRLAALFAQAQPQFLDPGLAVVCNPTFDRTEDLGGADADLIVDGTLLDLKTAKRPALDKRTVWQVLGYLLADTSDRHHISSVGWYFARHGLLWELPVGEFLRRLHGGDVDLGAARAEFADIVGARSDRAKSTSVQQDGFVVERATVFHPLESGRGRWHIAARDVAGSDRTNPARPACGTRSTLDLTAAPIRPAIGERWDHDDRLCFSCLQFARIGWGTLVEAAPDEA